MAAFGPAIAHDRKPADRSVELNRSVEIARIDCDVRPASRHKEIGAVARLSGRAQYDAAKPSLTVGLLPRSAVASH